MKRLFIPLIAAAALGLAVVGVGAGFAQQGNGSASTFLAKVAAKLGIGEDKLKTAVDEAYDETLDEAVTAGRLTQEQADTLKERGFDFAPQFGPPFGERGPRGGVQVMDAAATVLGMTVDVAPCVGMNLLGDVLFEGQRRHFGGRDIREAQQIGSAHQFWVSDGRVPEANVNRHVLKNASGEFCNNVVSHRDTFQHRVQLLRPLNDEREVVAKVDRLRCKEVGCRRLLVILATEIEVFRGTKPGSQAKEEGRCTLNDPTVRSRDHQARHQAIKDHELAQPHQWDICLLRHRQESLLEGRTECAGSGVFHC